MGIGGFMKSGGFVLTLLTVTVICVPFGIEQIGEATGLFRFPVTRTVKGWLAPSSADGSGRAAVRPVDWERYRRDLEEFTSWADGRCVAVISQPRYDPVVIEVPVEKRSERRIWRVPVTGCTAAGPANGGKGYAFVSGFDRPVEEGAVIAPTQDRCGYEIVCIGERSVWLRAVFDTEGDATMGIVRFPEFTRVEGESLVRGKRRYVARDAFPLVSGGWLMVDSFLQPDGTVFKIIDENYREVASILCVIIGEKGGG